MIHNVLINGKINTLLVIEDGESEYAVNPLFEAIKQQAERIELLEQQNTSLIKQEEILLSILDISSKGMAQQQLVLDEIIPTALPQSEEPLTYNPVSIEDLLPED